MLKNPTTMSDMLPADTIGARVDRLASDLHTFANYEQLAEAAANKGAVMKESDEFYSHRILDTLKRLLKGKTEEEIRMLLTEWPWILDI